MEDAGTVVTLATGLDVLVVGWSAIAELFAPALPGGGHVARATLRVSIADSLTTPEQWSPESYAVKLEWASATEARFWLRGGEGCLRVFGKQPERLEAELRVAPGCEPHALNAALRLLLSLQLPVMGGLLIHASAVALNGKAHIFLGHSGAGKTTTARRLGAEGAEVLAEDLLILRQDSDGRVLAEACRFDVAGARVCCAHAAPSWPVEAAYMVRKGAARSGLLGRTSSPLRSWSEALFSPRMLGRSSIALMEALAYAASHVPLYEFAAAPEGALIPAIEGRG